MSFQSTIELNLKKTSGEKSVRVIIYDEIIY
jgi:hypothetical protein